MRRRKALFASALAAMAATPALATITLNHGNALFVDTAPLTPTTTSYGGIASNTTDVFRPEGGVTTYHLYESGWSWRINGVDTREFAFSQAGMVEAGSGTPFGTRSYASVANGAFSAINSFSLTDGGVAGQALVTQTMFITNTSAAPLDISLFNYVDFDVNGTAGTDTGTWFDQANNIMQIVDGPSTMQYHGAGANAYQVTAFAILRTALTDAAITNLNNTGLPFNPGDFTGAFQWNRLIGEGQSTTVSITFAVNMPIPGPGALALLGVAGLVSRRRRN